MPGQAECRVLGHGRRAIPEPRIRPELAGIGATIRLFHRPGQPALHLDRLAEASVADQDELRAILRQA